MANQPKNKSAKHQSQFDIKNYSLRNGVIILAVAGLFALLMLRIDAFSEALSVLANTTWWIVIIGVAVLCMTFLLTAVSYKALALSFVPLKQLVIIQIACGFAGKVLPAGAGTLAVNARLLTKNRHTVLEAATVAGINNIMGFLGHTSLLVLTVIFASTTLDSMFDFNTKLPPYVWFLIFSIGIVVVFLFSFLPLLRVRLRQFLKEFVHMALVYRKKPLKILVSYLAALLITISYLGVLYISVIALGLSIDWLQLMVVFTIGIAAASITPTPGGIGGAEAGFVAALTLSGMSTTDALSVTLLYRLITYWLPILPGFIAFQYCVQKKYI